MRAVLKIVGALLLIALVAGVAAIFVLREPAPPGDVARATAVAAESYADAVTASRDRLDAVRREKNYPSLSVAVVVDGDVVWREAAGVADLRSGAPATPDTLYPTGSVGKPLTATAVMALAERGVLDLDAPINTYAPGLPDAYGAVTLRQLLSHQAGVRHYKMTFAPPLFTEMGINRRFASIEDSLSVFIDDPLQFAPDTGFEYSTFGYTLVGHVMEQATSRAYADIMAETVFGPSGMTDTGLDDGDGIPGRTTDYLALLGGLYRSPETDSSVKWSGGGLVSTPRDLATFGDAMMRGALVDPADFEVMTTPRETADGEENAQHYGLGWRRAGFRFPEGSDDVVVFAYHGGTSVGSECALMVTPSLRISVAACGNAYTGGSGDLRSAAIAVTKAFAEAHAN